jgi:hypothetical protein
MVTSGSMLDSVRDDIGSYFRNYNEWGYHPSSHLPGSSVASWLHKQSLHGNPMRSKLRAMLGLPDAGEPAPWEPGGEWHPNAARDRIDRAFAGIAESAPSSTLNAEVNFGDMLDPTSVRASFSDIFLPVSLKAAPKAVKAATDYSPWSFQ